MYDKIRYPGYRELVYKKADQEVLPLEPREIQKMLGLGGPPEMGGSQDRVPRGNKSKTVLFDCEFECGNIDQVRQRSPGEFDLWMRNDTNGNGNLQWFYFRMRNPANFTESIRIHIVNFTKGNSLFYYGMKPSLWSLRAFQRNGRGWYHGGFNVEYDISPYHSEINKMNPHKPKSYYAMSFTYKFDYDDDEVFVAYTIPYTYTQMQSHIRQIKELAEASPFNLVKFSSIGQSNGGVDLPLLRITNQTTKIYFQKPTIVIIGRQHSGETHSSFIIHGLINFLLSKTAIAFRLRESFEFWILPMVNPDGIIAGNYRCNAQGKDMNRCFFADDDPEAKLRLTEVELLRGFFEEHFSLEDQDKHKNLSMFLDIHAHSGQRDIFIYAPHSPEEAVNDKIKMLPALLDEMSPYFNYEGCKFGNEKYKKNCARLGIFRDFDLDLSYTIESSCWGYTNQETDATIQFKELDFIKFGQHLGEAFAKHLGVDKPSNEKNVQLSGLDLQIDFALYEDENENRRKIKNLKKKGQQPLGGKLLKVAQGLPKAEPVLPRAEAPEGDDEEAAEEDAGGDAMARQRAGVSSKPEAVDPKRPKVRRVQLIGKNGQQLQELKGLNSSSPEELQAQLAQILQQQTHGGGVNMPKLPPGKNIALNSVESVTSSQQSAFQSVQQKPRKKEPSRHERPARKQRSTEQQPKVKYGGIGRLGLAEPKKAFDPSEGRDYSQDAVPVDNQGPTGEEMKQMKSKNKVERAAADVPVPKPPAQVAAEKAEQQKREQIAEEEAKKNKTRIKKKAPPPEASGCKDAWDCQISPPWGRFRRFLRPSSRRPCRRCAGRWPDRG